MELDAVDKRIINSIQSDFPIDKEPFKKIAGDLGITEEEVLTRVRVLKDAGIIRRIGGNFAPDKLGYVSTLCAARVPAEKLDAFAEAVNTYSGVTHNYVRDDDVNVWFTFIAPSMDRIEESLAEIRRRTGVAEIMSLPATRVFKIKAEFVL
ncbi:MAG: AsnC family transcriptional regulator [Thermodesulfobacteriota bacterium]